MSKRHHQNKLESTNRVGTAMSVGPETSSSTMSKEGFMPSYDEVQKRAYQIHEEKGGSELENWLEAERVLKDEHKGW